MNAAHIINAITAMDESILFLRSVPYTAEKLDAIVRLRMSRDELAIELSNIKVEITS